MIGRYTDAELLAATSAARGAAHRAPFAEWSKDHTGHSSIVHHTNSWAERAGDFAALMVEVKRRGLATPACDCAEGSHEIDGPASLRPPQKAEG